MIYTMTISPSIDYVVWLDHEFESGKLNLMRDNAFFYGGKGVNVSQVLLGLGVENTALGFVAGFTGDEIEQGLKRMGCLTDFVKLKEGNSRINIKVKASSESEINAQGPHIDDESLSQLFLKLRNIGAEDILVLAGRVPREMPENMFARFMEQLESEDTKVVVDTSGENLVNTLPYHPFLIKPNHDELGALFNEQFSPFDKDRIVEAAFLLQEKGARNVMVSLASEGAILVTESGQVINRPAPSGVVRNSVGAGDSMVAGFLAGYMQSRDYEDAFCMGLAAGSATAFMDGLASGNEIRELYRFIR